MIVFGFAGPHMGTYASSPESLELGWIFEACHVTGRLMVPALFIPVIVIIVTVSFIKGLSPLLGGDVEIAGLTHLI
jgi:hypothetical protein